jgi:putative ABC transport system permease protein
MKIIDILKTANSNIWQSKLRTSLTIIAVFIGAFTLTLTNGIGSGISQYISEQVDSIGARNVLFIRAKQSSESPTSSDAPRKYDPQKNTFQFGGMSITVLTAADIARIKKVKGITAVAGRRGVFPRYIFGPNNAKFIVAVSQYVDGTNVAMNMRKVPDNHSSTPQIDLPANYVKPLGFSSYKDAIGKKVVLGIADADDNITEVTATVVGVPQKNLFSFVGTDINSSLFNRLFDEQSVGWPDSLLDRYPGATAHFESTFTDRQVRDLKRRLNQQGYDGQTVQDRIGIVSKVIGSVVIVFDIFALVALLAASFGVINTLLMSVQERTREIGLMKAMGMGRSRIFLLFSVEAILLGFWGSFLGVIAAVGAGQILNRFATQYFLKDFEGLHLLAFPLINLVVIILAIMFVAFLAGTLPASRASCLNPIDALRYE